MDDQAGRKVRVPSGGSLPGIQVDIFHLALKISQVPQNLGLQFRKLVHPLFIITSHQISELVSDLEKEKPAPLNLRSCAVM